MGWIGSTAVSRFSGALADHILDLKNPGNGQHDAVARDRSF
jgi:hypothetical protein